MYEKLKQLSENRAKHFDKNGDPSGWYTGSETFFKHLPEELLEALEEDKNNNAIYLEDELGDVLWVYMMLLNTLKLEGKIESVDSVVQRAYNKFSERVGKQGTKDIGEQAEWDRIKKGQKIKRQQEHKEKYGK